MRFLLKKSHLTFISLRLIATIFLLSFLPFSGIYSQTYNLTNGGSISSCSGTFYDPGGAGNYAGGTSDWTYTICNPSSGQPIYLQFTSFNLWSNSCLFGASVDELIIFDGPNTSSPQIGAYSNSNSPGTVVGTGGCLTFIFRRENFGGFLCSNNSGDPGWEAFISCTPPPSDGTNCLGALPFCTAITYNFPNLTNSSSPSSPDYGCLTTQPNPVWYYMEIDQGGTLKIDLIQTTGPNGSGSGIDVDFALYGPFSSLSSGCTAIMSGAESPLQCSYDPSSTETIGIGLAGGDPGAGGSTPPAAIAGEIYVLLLTNYSNQSGYIKFNQTAGTGSADCSIVTPCDISNITATPTSCNSSGVYDVSGSITFTSQPATGTLTITNSAGGSQTISAPFTSPFNYSFTGLSGSGGSVSITATFSDDATCTNTTSYTAPTCGCNVTASNSGPVCQGTNFDLTASNVAGATSYTWTGPAGYSSSSQNPTGIVPPTTSGTYTYTVLVGSVTGTCTSSTTLTVNAIPDTPIVDTVGPTCSSDGSALITNYSATLPDTYTFSPVGPAVDAVGGITGLSFGVSYTVSASNGSCTSTSSLAFGISQQFTVPVLTLNDQLLCTPLTADLTDPIVVSTDVGTLSYYTNSGLTNPVSDPSSVSSGIYYIESLFTPCAVVDSISVTITTTPTLSLNDQQVCAPATVDLTNPSVVSTDVGTITYYSDPSLSAQVSNPSTVGTGTYYIEATNANCSFDDSVKVVVTPLPVIDPLSPDPSCGFYVLPLITGADLVGASYWTGQGQTGMEYQSGDTLTSSQNLFIFAGINGCTDEETLVVTVNTLPSVLNVQSGGEYCLGDAISEIEVNVSGTAPWSLTYTLNGVTEIVNSSSNPILLGNSEGVYVVTEIADANCSNLSSETDQIVIKTCEIVIPTAFTPNGDLTNDFWEIVYLDEVYPENQVLVYDRWGGKIYESQKGNYLANPWDGTYKGKALPVGSYFYILNPGDGSDLRNGTVSILFKK